MESHNRELGFDGEPYSVDFHPNEDNVHEKKSNAIGEVKVVNDGDQELLHVLQLKDSIVFRNKITKS